MRTPQAIFRGRLGTALTGAAALLLAGSGVVVGGGAAQAQGSGFINVMTGMQQAVSGGGWSDTTVTVAVGGSPVGTATVTNGQFQVQLASAPATGVQVSVTGDQTAHLRTVTMPPLEVTQFDVPGGLVHGTGGPASDGWGDVQVSFGNPWIDNAPPTAAVVDPTTKEWTADVGAAAFDLRSGSLGGMAHQSETDGDMVSYGTPVPNPTVDVKDSHGVMLHGWAPGSTVTITLYNPGTNTAYPFQATVDSTGEWWGNPPPAPWDVILPGWTASATGPVAMRETATITKSIVVPKPYPVPEMAGFTISDTVTGTQTATTVGPGSMVNVSPTCPDLTTPWRQAMTGGSGYFAMDFSQPPEPNKGGGTCAAAPVSFGYAVSDLDGDQVHANWQVDPEPSVSAESPLWDGQQFKVDGTGFDLMMVQLQQCELFGDSVGRCDPSTRLVLNANPGQDWPLGGADFEVYDYTAKQYLEFPDGEVVDCAEVPCAVLVIEPLRQDGDVGAIAPLTYNRAVALDLTASAKGTVSTVTGAATLTGTVTASEPTWVHLSGTLVQRLGRTRVVRGDFDSWVYVEEAGATAPWSVRVDAYTGQAFGSGFAELTVSADLGDEGPSWAQTTQTVKLSATKVTRR